MMKRVLADIKDAGYAKVMLCVLTDNDGAIKFYGACGFVTYEK